MRLGLFAAIIALLIGLFWFVNNRSSETIRLGGGPQGGTFVVFAEGLAELLRQEWPEQNFKVVSSGGSVANLKALERGKVAVALAYAGDADLASKGQLNNDKQVFKQLRALARVYGSTAQLVVLKESVIHSPEDLYGRRVAIGSSGSGAAQSAERYFRILGLWEDITPLYMGYDLAMDELFNRRTEAVWQMVGAPSASIVKTNRLHPLRLIDLSELAEQSEFLLEYPFYSRATIPAGTYRGQDQPIKSFQDNTLLLAHVNTDPKLVTTLLNALYSPAGINYLREIHPIGRQLDPKKALQGVQIPLHPAAAEFWRKRGLLR